ncbi:MAG: NUDIX domain-containing protein [Pseudomonadota bacterium]
MADNTIIQKLIHTWSLFKRPMTLGVRVLVENELGEILLVKHTYVSGWYFPGGGIETRETAEDAVRKELMEETSIEVEGDVQLVGVYLNNRASKRDHVLLYKCVEWSEIQKFEPNREISEIGFFPVDALPDDVTPATRRRILEIYEGEKVSPYW